VTGAIVGCKRLLGSFELEPFKTSRYSRMPLKNGSTDYFRWLSRNLTTRWPTDILVPSELRDTAPVG